MCGIAGVIVSDARRVDPRFAVREMQARLVHRGPDDCGLFISNDQRCALAHTRLSILDLSSAGHQPMCFSEQGAGSHEKGARYWIVFNGEIYNYRQLRQELDAEREASGVKREEAESQSSSVTGHLSPVSSHWNSNSDTEVILRAYARWGRDCVHHLRGMFAFSIWDEQEQELFLARDPLGIKPLYYYQTDRLFLFASEIRALLASGSMPRKLSQEGLASYLQFGSVQDPSTIIDGIHSLLPGHVLCVKRSRNTLILHQSRFSRSISQSRNLDSRRNPKSREAAATELRQILEDSIRAHLISDVPVAAFLSGGIDSSVIVAMMSQVADQRPKTFSVVFEESEFSERDHAELIARRFGTEHHEVMLAEEGLLKLLPDALAAMDVPTMDGINSYIVAKAVRDAGIKVALSGLGSDELFGGYPSFRRATQLDALAKMPSAVRHIAAASGRLLTNGSARHRKFWDLIKSDCSPYAAYAISRRLFAPAEIASLLARDQRSDVRDRNSAVIGLQSSVSDERDVINEVSRLELGGYMSNTLLRDTDQMSMANALEVRVPFVDSEVVNYVMALPGEWKMNGGRPKPLLVDAVRDLLPEEIWRRPKMGFTLPFERWMCSSLKAELDETFSRDSLRRVGVDAEHAKSVWDSFKKSPQHQPWSRPWALYVLAKWCHLNDVAL